MKYTKKNATFSALAALFFAASAFCMETEVSILSPAEKSTELLSLLLSIDFCDHFMICKMNRLNRQLYETIKQTAPDRKKYIEKNMKLEPSDPLQQIVWHSCGSAYGFIEPKEERSFGLSTYWVGLNQVYLDYNKAIKHNKLSSEQISCPIRRLKHGKWNENGTMCFYYLQECYNSPEVRELSSFSENGISNSKRCVVSFSASSGRFESLYALYALAFLPNLFRAFINSSVISDDNRDPANVGIIFNLQGVTIPAGFEEDLSFHELPLHWKKAITDRYQKQQAKK
jgi:hypothetical protein